MENFIFKKSLGQNFLTDDNIVKKIVDIAHLSKNDLVIEIGPGSGSLTKELANQAGFVLAYEIDERLKSILEKNLKAFSNVKIVYSDFLERVIKEDVKGYCFNKLYVVANLPYYITTPIIEKIIREDLPIEKIVVMVQKEVGDRFSAKIGTKDYNSLSIFLQYHYEVRKEFIVSRNCFVPKPNVDSVIVSLARRKNKEKINHVDKFEQLVRDSFRYKRKNLRNNLQGYSLPIISSVLSKYGVDLTTRAESISLEIFIDLVNALFP